MEIIKREFFTPIKADFQNIAQASEGQFIKEIGFAIQHLNKQPYLLKCLETSGGKTSLKMAVLNVAQTGLTLNPVSKQAYLVPRYRRESQSVEACLEPSYIGLVKLLTDTGSVKAISCQLIYEGDNVEIDMASDRKVLKHIPYILTGKPKGKIIAAYSIAKLNDNGFHCEIMSYEDVMDIRERSESYKAFKAGKVKTSIWTSDESEMIRKTVIKRHYKYLPKSDRMEKVETAIDQDNGLHGFRELVSAETKYYIEDLIESSTFEPHEKATMTGDLTVIEYTDQARKMIDHLKEHQPDRIDSGANYNQTDINNKLDKITAK